MPIPSVNSPSLTVNAVFAEEVLVSGSIDAQGKLHVAARAVILPAQCQNAGTPSEAWTVAGDRQTVFIPDVSNLAGDPSTADLASLQAQFNAAFSALVTAIGAVNTQRGLV